MRGQQNNVTIVKASAMYKPIAQHCVSVVALAATATLVDDQDISL